MPRAHSREIMPRNEFSAGKSREMGVKVWVGNPGILDFGGVKVMHHILHRYAGSRIGFSYADERPASV
jgi:hypothetical protein